MANINLTDAKSTKNNEFYTQLSDIQSELSNYQDKFQDKVVFCNCDDPFESNFVKYFLMNFNRLGLKTLIATGYKTSYIGGIEFGEINTPYVLRVTDTSKYLVGTQTDLDVRGAKKFLETEGCNVMTPLVGNYALNEFGEPICISYKESYPDDKGKTRTRWVQKDLYYEPGDFRSNMSVELLKEADIVVTNPPFSLFREYVAQLMQYKKDFLIIANKNSITYKEIFPLIKENKIWVGCRPMGGGMWFPVPEGNEFDRIINGVKMKNVPSTWFTNLDHAKRHKIFTLDCGYTYYGHEDMYPKYDNYDVIDIGKVVNNGKRQGDIDMIPCDYMGVMGVPISFMDRYCSEQFEIVGMAEDNGRGFSGSESKWDGKNPHCIINGKIMFKRIFIKRRK